MGTGFSDQGTWSPYKNIGAGLTEVFLANKSQNF